MKNNSVFQALQRQPQPNVMQDFNLFRQNPMQYLLSKNINIPQDLQQDPKGAVQYLLNNGQMTQEQFNSLNSMVSRMGMKLTQSGAQRLVYKYKF